MTDEDREFMRSSIDEMKKATSPGPRVGAAVARDGVLIAAACRGGGKHAERAAIELAELSGLSLRGATLYTTLEPCIDVGSAKESCADLIARVGISTVFIGSYDPNPLIYRAGWARLRDAGIALRDYPADMREEVESLNSTFAEHFTSGMGPNGGAKFDYMLNESKFEIQFAPGDARSIVTRWSTRGGTSIHAYADRPQQVALARYAREFHEIDDPRVFDFSYTAPIHVGEIAVFVSEDGAALVKVVEVEGGRDHGAERTSLKIKYEIRVWK
ncbi:dCMP deaminase [Polaromonas sp. CF318]|uniref:dCMP deaminase n=1 Tax=Polaromonas sp. CF318 TaxID=1144318 RepID=UPI0012FC2E30|nr:dCMP deaminase [Polaromonas sp. CF318]